MRRSVAVFITFFILHSSFFIFSSCSDMLTIDTGDKSYTNANDTLYSYLGILKHVQDIAERQVILNELRGDLVSPTTYITDTLHAIANFDNPADGSCSMLDISDYYAVINNCNLYIANCDTNAVKSNIKYMLSEYYQVQTIRAWTYLQLIQLYGEVPYISEPIASLDVVKNFNYSANLVNKDNLLDRLLADGLDKVGTTFPHYGTYNNGAIDITASLCYFQPQLVLGDLYLLRGANTGDYQTAANYYWNYLLSHNGAITEQYVSATKLRGMAAQLRLDDPYAYSSTNNWGAYASFYSAPNTGINDVITSIPSSANAQFGTMLMRVADIFGYTPTSSQNNETKLRGMAAQLRLDDPYAYSSTNNWGAYASFYSAPNTGINDVITSIPSSANAQFGTMLMRVADIFGYTPTSSQNNETTTNSDGEEESNSSGAISVIPTYKAQAIPSPRYKAISDAQTYVNWDIVNMEREDLLCGDARYKYATAQVIFSEEGFTSDISMRLASKAARGMTFYYTIPIYRKTLVWLRFAEAINRAGFPQIAFAILKDGLNEYNWPQIGQTRSVREEIVDAEGNPVLDEEGNPSYREYTQYFTRYNQYGALHYVDSAEIADFKFDPTNEILRRNYGIHARGCGYGEWRTAGGTTAESPVTNITGYNDSTVFDFAPRLLLEGVDVKKASKNDIINAVENVISDELALELAFEGYRFSDLVRMANHKNASGYDGTAWLAAKIADRDVQANNGTRNNDLYNKLLNPSNWYFTKPTWSIK